MNTFMFNQNAAGALKSRNFAQEWDKVKNQFPQANYATLGFSDKLFTILQEYIEGKERLEDHFYEKIIREYLLEQDHTFMQGISWKNCETMFKELFDEETFNKLCVYVLQNTYKHNNAFEGTFHQMIALYYTGNALSRVTPEHGERRNVHTKNLKQRKRDITVDVYFLYTELKKLFGTQLRDLSVKFDESSHPPTFSLGFQGKNPIMRPSIEPRVVKEGIGLVDSGRYNLGLPDTQNLLKQVLLYR